MNNSEIFDTNGNLNTFSDGMIYRYDSQETYSSILFIQYQSIYALEAFIDTLNDNVFVVVYDNSPHKNTLLTTITDISDNKITRLGICTLYDKLTFFGKSILDEHYQPDFIVNMIQRIVTKNNNSNFTKIDLLIGNLLDMNKLDDWIPSVFVLLDREILPVNQLQLTDVKVGATDGHLGNQPGYGNWNLDYYNVNTTTTTLLGHVLTSDTIALADSDVDVSGTYFKNDTYPHLLTYVYTNFDSLQNSLYDYISSRSSRSPKYFDVREITTMSQLFNITAYWPSAWYQTGTNKWENLRDYNRWYSLDISKWNVSNVTSMYYMFSYCSKFCSRLDNWDVSKVTNMRGMFNRCNIFNSPLYKWDVSRVNNMNRMFFRASYFNQDIRYWNVSNVTDISFMFVRAYRFHQDLHRWNKKSWATDYNEGMFEHCYNQAQNNIAYNYWPPNSPRSYTDISNGNIVQAVSAWNANWMSASLTYGGHISEWDVSQVTSFEGVFKNNSNVIKNIRRDKVDPHISTNYRIDYWDISSVTDMSGAFENCTQFNGKLSWDTSNVTTMSSMFKGCTTFDNNTFTTHTNTDIPLKPGNMMAQAIPDNRVTEYIPWVSTADRICWNIDKVTDMSSFLEGCTKFNKPINFTRSTTTNINFASFLKGCTKFNDNIDFSYNSTQPVTTNSEIIAKKQKIYTSSMDSMFEGCSKFEREIRYWKLYNNNNISTNNIFVGATEFINKYLSNIDNSGNIWTTDNSGNKQVTDKFFNLNQIIDVSPNAGILIGPGLEDGYIYSDMLDSNKSPNCGKYDVSDNSLNAVNTSGITIDLSSNAVYLLEIGDISNNGIISNNGTTKLELHGKDNQSNSIQKIVPGFNAIVSPINVSGNLISYTDMSGNLTDGINNVINNIQLVYGYKNDMYYKLSKNTDTDTSLIKYPIESKHGYIVYSTAPTVDSSWNIITSDSS